MDVFVGEFFSLDGSGQLASERRVRCFDKKTLPSYVPPVSRPLSLHRLSGSFCVCPSLSLSLFVSVGLPLSACRGVPLLSVWGVGSEWRAFCTRAGSRERQRERERARGCRGSSLSVGTRPPVLSSQSHHQRQRGRRRSLFLSVCLSFL